MKGFEIALDIKRRLCLLYMEATSVDNPPTPNENRSKYFY